MEQNRIGHKNHLAWQGIYNVIMLGKSDIRKWITFVTTN